MTKMHAGAAGLALEEGTMEDAGAVIGLIVLVLVYFLPALIASRRKHASAYAIAALNLFLGWTFLGWVAALVWSLAAHGGANAKGGG